MTPPKALVVNILPCLPGPWSSPKPHSFWFELTNLASVWEPQSILSVDPNKGMCTLPCPPLVAPWSGCLWPLGPVSNKRLYFPSDPFLKKLWLNIQPPQGSTTNVNLTKSQQSYWNAGYDWVGLGWNLRFCISKGPPGEADAGFRNNLSPARLWTGTVG